MIMEFDNFAIHRKLMKQGIHETKMKCFGFKIRDISLFENQ